MEKTRNDKGPSAEKGWAAEVYGINRRHSLVSGRPCRAFCETYGCQQNVADMEKIKGLLLSMGYEVTKDKREADLVVVNTCAVREHAEMRALGNIGALSHLKRKNPGLVIAVCGCMVQQERIREKLRKSFPYVDLVFGPGAIPRLPELLYRRLIKGGRVFDDMELSEGPVAEGIPAARAKGPKAWLSIMAGCDNFCSYCIVPYVRGRERSRGPEAVEAEFLELLEKGYKDITLLGQNVNSYGRGLSPPVDFPALLRRLASHPGDYRLRFMTSHPKDASADLFSAMAEHPAIARHIHLPFQSGSDRILRLMNRGYTKAGYLALVEKARALMPGIVLTSDVIVGFPGETEEDFQETLSLVQEVEFASLFTFLYSKREGTPAANMAGAVPEEEKSRRFDRLLKIQNEISEKLHKAYVGQSLRVLVDGKGRDREYPLTARTDGGRLVYIRGKEEMIGAFVRANIVKSSVWALFGEVTGA